MILKKLLQEVLISQSENLQFSRLAANTIICSHSKEKFPSLKPHCSPENCLPEYRFPKVSVPSSIKIVLSIHCQYVTCLIYKLYICDSVLIHLFITEHTQRPSSIGRDKMSALSSKQIILRHQELDTLCVGFPSLVLLKTNTIQLFCPSLWLLDDAFLHFNSTLQHAEHVRVHNHIFHSSILKEFLLVVLSSC